ncbi:hypothetical protein, partial [Ramlibacter monticola]
IGGAGNDTYVVHEIADVIVEAGAAGTDEVRTFTSAYTLSVTLENLTYVGTGDFAGTGNAFA